tara:strand:- start:146 stop:280 length:135 start_codon:yes stop_codon:yes gene_type:complete
MINKLEIESVGMKMEIVHIKVFGTMGISLVHGMFGIKMVRNKKK